MEPDQHHEYEYPDGLSLKPGTDLHDKLRDLVNSCVKRSMKGRGTATDEWREMDHLTTAYVSHETADDLATRTADPRKPVNVVVSMASAMQETFLSYMYQEMLGGREFYPMQGRGGRTSVIKTALLERVLQAQAQWFSHDLSHVTHWRDMHQYGIGALAPVWTQTERVHTRDIVVDEAMAYMAREAGENYAPGDTIRISEPTIIEEGSELRNVDPYQLLLDPDTPVSRYQKARFCGYLQGIDAYELITREANPEENLFNGRYVLDNVKKGHRPSIIAGVQKTGRLDRYGISDSGGILGSDMLEPTHSQIAYVFITLIPRDYNLGDSNKPEKWMISVADEEIVVQCQRLTLDHGMYPLVVGAPGTSGYDVWALSSMIKGSGLYKALDWNFRSWMDMDRKAITGTTIIDPKFFYVNDWTDPAPGKFARLKQPLPPGDSIERHFHTVQSPPASGHHMQSASAIINMIYTVGGTNQMQQNGSFQGAPERPTAAGMQIANQAGQQRPQFMAQMITSQCWPMLTKMLSYNTIQFMSQKMTYSIVGSRYEQELLEEYGGAPSLIIDGWNLEPSFNAVPISRFKSEAGLQQMLSLVERGMSIPEIGAKMLSGYNLPGMIDSVARRCGFEDVKDWHLAGNSMNVNTMDDSELAAEVANGNQVPLQQAVGGANA